MSKREYNEKNTPSRPSIKVSIPIEVYHRRMRKVQEKAYEEYITMKEKEKDKNAVQYSEVNSTGSTINQTDVSQEQTHSAVNHPSVKSTEGYLGIPVGSLETPSRAQQYYSRSTNRPHPYRYQRNPARAERAQRSLDLNNNLIDQQPQELTPGYRENGSDHH